MAAMRESEQYDGARRHALQGKKFKVACYVTYGRMACGTLSISEDGKVEKENLFWEIYVLYGGQMCYFNRQNFTTFLKNKNCVTQS